MPDANGGKQAESRGSGGVLSIQGQLWEWYAMDEDTRRECWDDLVNWVIWLSDTYELATEYRLPSCWPQHPGLVQELWTLKMWREALYTTIPGDAVTSGREAGSLAQHARQWHSEMRNLMNATKFYAPQCLAGHKNAPMLHERTRDVTLSWHGANPTSGIRPPEQTHKTEHRIARNEKRDDRDVMPVEKMNQRLFARSAKPLNSNMVEIVHYLGTWWIFDSFNGEWLKCKDPRLVGQITAVNDAISQLNENSDNDMDAEEDR